MHRQTTQGDDPKDSRHDIMTQKTPTRSRAEASCGFVCASTIVSRSPTKRTYDLFSPPIYVYNKRIYLRRLWGIKRPTCPRHEETTDNMYLANQRANYTENTSPAEKGLRDGCCYPGLGYRWDNVALISGPAEG